MYCNRTLSDIHNETRQKEDIITRGIIILSALLAFGCDGKNGGNEPECGNGRVEVAEECDGGDLGGETCASLGLEGGDLACDDDCTYDVGGCTGTSECGNDVVDGEEDCDGADLGGETCETCSSDCGRCTPVCGDGVCDMMEWCGSCPVDCGPCPAVCGNAACESWEGEDCVSCFEDCGSCPPTCGNGVCDAVETCNVCVVDCGHCPNYG